MLDASPQLSNASAPPPLHDDPRPPATPIRRFAAAAVGAVVLMVCTTFTLFTVLAGPLGVLGARALARRRGAPLTRAGAWVGAVLACFVAVPLAFGALLAAAPPGTIGQVRAAMDSAQAGEKPTEIPDWLERVTPPGTAQRSAATSEAFRTGPFMLIFGILAGIMVCAIFGTIAGSIGWLASLLFAYTITGRWIRSGAPPPARMATAAMLDE
jgi:hypothetical protein